MPATPVAQLDAALAGLAGNKDAWAKLAIAKRIAYLEKIALGVQAEAEPWTRKLNTLKGLDPASAAAGEDWLAGPMTTARNVRLLIETLKAGGQPRPPALKQRQDGQWVAEVFPTNLQEKILYTGWRAEVWMEPGKPPSQGSTYRTPQSAGKVCLVLGAGNVTAIAPTDVLYKMFVENEVCILKMNPVNEIGGPHIQRAFQCLIDDGYLAVVYGGAEVGKHLTDHALVDTIHITGSDRTHDAIIWGATPDEQAKNKAAGTARLTKHISSELGCVTPVIVVPGAWTDADMDFQARQIAGMIAQNGSFNCNAAKVLVTSRAWPLRERFMEKVEAALRNLPARKAYYPGAQQRYAAFIDNYPNAKVLSERVEGSVPWTLIPDVRNKKGEYALCHEAFCGVLAETALDAADAGEFLTKATAFCNDEVWGTLSCIMLIDGATQKTYAAAFDQAIATLRYGGIAVNGWAAVLFGLMQTTWGAFPGHTLQDIQSGRGVVHNTFLFDHPQKSVAYLPFRLKPTPVWFADHKTLNALGEKITRYEFAPSMLKVPGIAVVALRG